MNGHDRRGGGGLRAAALLVGLALAPAAARAQVEGVRLEAGPVFLTKSGKLGFGPGAIESDAGFAFRGRLRFGLGPVSLAAELQASNQKYGRPAAPGAPESLDATFLGGTAALHPLSLAGIAPYAEIGVGRVFFGDEAIDTEHGSTAGTYGLGVTLGGKGKIGLDVGLRLMRLSHLTGRGVVGEFKYDPKVFSVLLSLKL